MQTISPPPEQIFSTNSRLMFGQVREDADVDIFLAKQNDSAKHLFVIASGGCTAFSLLSQGDYRIDALDISNAQIALCELKKHVFEQSGFLLGRAACESNAREAYASERHHLSLEHQQILDTKLSSLKAGLNNAGFVDQTMRLLTRLFYVSVHSSRATEEFLYMRDIEAQRNFYNEEWSTPSWNAVTNIAFDKRFLALAHGEAAMSLVPDDFTRLMKSRIERALTQFSNRYNPYVWQAFRGQYNGLEDGYPAYLQEANAGFVDKLSKLHFHCDDLLSWLQKQPDGSLDYFNLSNILELLPKEYAQRIAPHLIRCSTKGAIICVRSIFPRKNQRSFDASIENLKLDIELTAHCEKIDRSLFCNFYEIYRVL